MDLITLDDDFRELDLVENYKSLLWTERYSRAGDFQVTSNNVEETISLLPLESYVRLAESTVPMIVEAHKIEKKPREAPVLTVVGRTFETVMERRASVNAALGPARAPWTVEAMKPSDAAYQVMRTVLGDQARYWQYGLQAGRLMVTATNGVAGAGSPAVSTLDAFVRDDGSKIADLTLPMDYETMLEVPVWLSAQTYLVGDLVYNDVTVSGKTTRTYWRAVAPVKGTAPAVPAWESLMYDVKVADLYSTVMEMINANHHGIKSVLLGDGTVGIEIYNGRNLTGYDSSGAPISDVPVVVFDARFDQFDDSTYLLSQQGSANVAYVYGATASELSLKTTNEPKGLARRVIPLDLSQDSTANTPAGRRNRALVELYKRNVTALFEGEIAEQVAAGYNQDYFLGDIIKLTGEYGLSRNVRVAEFIRSSDNTGEKSYPTFENVLDENED